MSGQFWRRSVAMHKRKDQLRRQGDDVDRVHRPQGQLGLTAALGP
jgi:hypothetical protein